MSRELRGLRSWPWAAAAAWALAFWCGSGAAAEPARFDWPKRISGEVRDNKGDPVEGVRVRLDVVTVDESAPGRNERLLFTSSRRSDAGGAVSFDLSGCPAPKTRPFYLALAGKAPGYAEMRISRWYSQGQPAPVSDRFEVLQMDPGRVVRGRIADPAGKPVAGALIKAAVSFGRESPRRPQFWILAPRLSGERGEFELAAPYEADCQLWVASRDYVAQLVVIPRDTQRVEIELEEGTRIKGVARTEAGRPLAGAVVVLEKADWGDDEQPPLPLPLYQGVRTDARGAFRLPPAKDDCRVYLAQAAAAAYELASVDGELREALITADEPPPPMLPRFYSFGGGGQVELTLETGPTLFVSGRVRWPDGRPAAGVEVRSYWTPAELRLRSPFVLGGTTTDEQGSYSIELPRPISELTLAVGLPYQDTGQVRHRAIPDAEVSAPSKSSGTIQFTGPLEADVNHLDWTLRPERSK